MQPMLFCILRLNQPNNNVENDTDDDDDDDDDVKCDFLSGHSSNLAVPPSSKPRPKTTNLVKYHHHQYHDYYRNSDDNDENDDDDDIDNASDVDDANEKFCLSSKLHPKTSSLVKYNQNHHYFPWHNYQALKPQTLYNTSSILS